MTVQDIKEILKADVLCEGDGLGAEVHTACGSDMMSDVLAFVKDQSVLLTGLVNPQVVRTADMMDMVCVIFVRGKDPTPEMIELANDREIVLMKTPLRMFTGLRPAVQQRPARRRSGLNPDRLPATIRKGAMEQ